MHLEVNGERVSFGPGFKASLHRDLTPEGGFLWSVVMNGVHGEAVYFAKRSGKDNKIPFLNKNNASKDEMKTLFIMWAKMTASISGLNLRWVHSRFLTTSCRVVQVEFIDDQTADAIEGGANAAVQR